MIVVVVPVLGRPANAQPLADSLAAATTVPHRLVFVCSPDDKEQERACDSTGADVLTIFQPSGPGDFARKVNAAYRGTHEPWIFQAADDVTFEPGWDVEALASADATGALVIGTQDGHNPEVKRGRHSTHSLISRAYIDDPGASMDGPGTVFSTAYGHQYVDTELVALAKHRGVWAFSGQSRVTHHHPFWVGRDRMDDTYRRGLASSREDARIFTQRSRLWTGGPARV